MDPEPNVMDQKSDEMKLEIDKTRSDLTEKLETLENEVLGTVHSVTSTVEETIDNVKETVQETVQTVKRNFDLRYQVEQHPWPMVGGSVAAGFVAGCLMGEVRRGRQGQSYQPETYPSPSYASSPSRPQEAAPPAERQPGVLDHLMHQFEPEIRKVKEMAIGTVFGLVRDMLKQAVPAALAAKVGEVFDSATTKLGGQPVSGPVVEPTPHPTNPTASR